MKNTFYLVFENGLPKGTAQQKGEAIRFKSNGEAYIQHYKKDKVSALRRELVLRMKRYAPKIPAEGAVRLRVWVCFDVKDPALWGKYKTTRPDCDNYVKEIKDAMTDCKFWKDDSQVAKLEVIKTYAEKGSIAVTVENLNELKAVRE